MNTNKGLNNWIHFTHVYLLCLKYWWARTRNTVLLQMGKGGTVMYVWINECIFFSFSHKIFVGCLWRETILFEFVFGFWVTLRNVTLHQFNQSEDNQNNWTNRFIYERVKVGFDTVICYLLLHTIATLVECAQNEGNATRLRISLILSQKDGFFHKNQLVWVAFEFMA